MAGDFEQITPGYRLSLSLNLGELLRDRSPKSRALEGDVEAARRAIRFKMFQVYRASTTDHAKSATQR